ncbi:MAG: cob(I)yrinic acid a,c-diamide adenosyltransferase [Omnitrophica bacterium]|nr:cob(I)yrinic acid a,c-diamide adenosyltransferase [Candidatus Omnitrophota bacterium]
MKSIVTKTGDKGKTSLCQGRRVNKDNVRIEACGVLDELCSYLGLAKSLIKAGKIKKTIETIQKDLFVIGTELATEKKFISQIKKRISFEQINYLEKIINSLERNSKLIKPCFQLPGHNLLSSSLDVSRTIARKLERRTTTLIRKKVLADNHILVYLNRLSDLLYLLARLGSKEDLALKK